MQFLIIFFGIKSSVHINLTFLLFYQKSTKNDEEFKKGNVVVHAIIIVCVSFFFMFFLELVSLKPFGPAITL